MAEPVAPVTKGVIMSDTQVRDSKACFPDGSDPISAFAAGVLDVLVDRNRRTTSALRRDLVVALSEGMVAQDEMRIGATLREIRRACISPSAMADTYIPEAAALLGAYWATDRMGFSDVTIATARLQALVRAIGTRWGGDATHVPGRRSILMVVPEGEDHTLGAVVASGRLRRMGLSVCLRLGPSRTEVMEILRTRSFDAAMISIGHGQQLEAPRKMVNTLRCFGPRGLPILVGGSADASGADLVAGTGADFATQDLGAALAFCGLAGVGQDSAESVAPLRRRG